MPFEHYSLSNGLQVVLQQDKTFENVSVEFWLKAGTSYDKPGEYGLAHFFEHVMPFNSLDSTDRKLLKDYRNGSNAQVRKDYSRFYQRVDPKALEAVLKQSAGRLLAIEDRITLDKVESERIRVLAEIERNAMRPHWSGPGGMAIYSGTFGENHPYGSSGYGLLENNKNFQREDFIRRYTDIVYANNVVLFIVGNFEIEIAKEYIEKYFNQIESREKKEIPLKRPKDISETVTMKAPHPDDSINTLIHSWAVPEFGSKDDGQLKLIASILQERLSNHKALPTSFISITVDTDMFQYAGQFFVRTTFSNTFDSTKVESVLLSEINRILDGEINSEDLNQAKLNQIEQISDMQQNLGFQWSRTELLGESLLFTGDPNAYFDRLQTQMLATEKGIVKSANKWLKKPPFRVLFIPDD